MARRRARNLTCAALFVFGASASAYAGPITFTFDTTTTPSCTGLSGGAAPTTIQSYMNCVLGGTYVTSVSSGAIASKGAAAGTGGTSATAGYTADGHVVGTGSPLTSLTLGNTNNATVDGAPLTAGPADAFIMTGLSSSQFSFQFGNGFTIAAGSTITFDYEIFPNASCARLYSATYSTACGGPGNPNLPDFKFQIDGSPAGPTMWGVQPGTSSTYANSPAMPTGETAPQNMGIFTYTVGSALVNPNLAFVDWPATIGIDNLSITPPPPPSVPEPVTLVLVGLGMAGLRSYRRRMGTQG